MTEITLSKPETKLLLEAAERGGSLEFAESTKPSSRERILGRLLRDALVLADEAGHHLTQAGYRAVGLRPPRAKRAEGTSAASDAASPRTTKGSLVLDLLGRGEGASLVELTAATGWLPHTARAALSRLRSGGKPLAKGKREDGVTVYRLVPDEPKPARATRKPRAEATIPAAP